jgi:asparagine synthase (glutamine-hydrolysing)
MPGIAGVSARGKRSIVGRMLNKMAHRGRAGQDVAEVDGVTLGAEWPECFRSPVCRESLRARDGVGEGHLAEARVMAGRLVLSRDPIGAAPLYYGPGADGELCFASEVKGLLEATQEVNELPPGCRYDGERLTRYYELRPQPAVSVPPGEVACGLRSRLAGVVRSCIRQDTVGAWLSGGLDSSTMAAMARPYVRKLYTVAGGVAGAPDLEFARQVAEFIGSEHAEVIVNLEEMLAVLPKVIYHLESFDALLVRSSIMNYLVAERVSQCVPEAFSGEGGDELFAGYEYLKAIDRQHLADELVDITGRLHNTALQRVDRCAAAHGLVVHVPFVDPDTVDYALRIPAEFKIRDGVEKWVLRQACEGLLPAAVLSRPKAKFWEGAGVGELLADYADEHISDEEFARERTLRNGWVLSSKEELMYYRIFQDAFGALADLSWMGRTKGAPRISGC